MIKIENLSVSYKNTNALKNISLEMPPGQIYGFAGPNGAGKSTLLKALTGIVSKYEGKIFFGGIDSGRDRYKIRQITGYAPETVELVEHLNGRELLQMVSGIRKLNDPDKEIDTLVELLNLQAVQHQLINTYSHGMRQKLSIAVALVGDPQYLIFDEALNGIDPVTLYDLQKEFRNRANSGKTVIISSHILELIQKWADRVIVMDSGKLLANWSRQELDTICVEKKTDIVELFVGLVRDVKNQQPGKPSHRYKP